MASAAQTSDEVTRVLRRLEQSDRDASDELLLLVYRELRSLARSKMAREPPGQTLDPTGLVHEAYLRLLRGSNPSFRNRAHFFAAAARAMQRILVERARRHAAVKHGGATRRVALDAEQPTAAVETNAEDIVALDQALQRLEKRDAEMAELVRLRFFAGMTVEETASLLARPRRTIERSWTAARAWLLRELSAGVSR